MEVSMWKIAKSVLAGASLLALSATFAAAEVVCNEDGDCWRVREKYDYKPELRLKVYPNDWRWEEKDNDHYRWRDAPSDKRGYWRQGVWVEISD
jgi:hypothetical protein